MNSLFLNRTPEQPLNLQRSTVWIPPNRYYGDRFPRTLQEAFGPYAELHIERRSFVDRYLGHILAAAVALLVVFASWACSNYPAS